MATATHETAANSRVLPGRGRGRSAQKLAEIRIKIPKRKEHGFVVEHHFHHDGELGSYREPESHAFSGEDGDKMLAHVAKHARVNVDSEKESEKAEGGEKEGEGESSGEY